jgi:hypothetical protein
MKVLLVHPKDSPVEGPWASGSWDLVVDLGWAGSHRYAQWSKLLGCPVCGLYGFREWKEDVGAIKQALRFGLGLLVDDEWIDWTCWRRFIISNCSSFNSSRKLRGKLPPRLRFASRAHTATQMRLPPF